MKWRSARFKGKSVWVQVDDAGEPQVQDGRVPMRYSKREGASIYRGGIAGIGELQGEIVELDVGGAPKAASQGASLSKASGFGSAGSRTAAQAAAAAVAAQEAIDALSSVTARIFTDGSCQGNPGPAGAGVRLELPDGAVWESSVSLGQATNNVAEIYAIYRALTLLDEVGLPLQAPVAILSDSKYANGVVAQNWKAKNNVELIQDTKALLAKRPSVRVIWVAGHAGVYGHERADDLAGEGAKGVSLTRQLA